MSKQCTAKNRHGRSCGAWALSGSDKCSLHSDPERARRMATKRRRNLGTLAAERHALEPPRTATDVRNALAETMAQVHGGQLDPRTANTLAYVGSSLLRAIEISDLERRLGALEATQRVQERAFLQSSADAKSKDEG